MNRIYLLHGQTGYVLKAFHPSVGFISLRLEKRPKRKEAINLLNEELERIRNQELESISLSDE